jgi:hypothetical protein
MTRQGRRPARPRTLVVVAVFLYLACALAAGVAVLGHAQAVQSSYVQAHGVRDSATVVSVDNIVHRDEEDGTTYTHAEAEVAVRLQQPVNGTFNSLVWVPGRDNSRSGDVIAVLVDPRQPGYSELPGSPYEGSSSGWIVAVGFSVLFLVVGVWVTREAVRLSLQRRFVGDFAYSGSPPDRF